MCQYLDKQEFWQANYPFSKVPIESAFRRTLVIGCIPHQSTGTKFQPPTNFFEWEFWLNQLFKASTLFFPFTVGTPEMGGSIEKGLLIETRASEFYERGCSPILSEKIILMDLLNFGGNL